MKSKVEIFKRVGVLEHNCWYSICSTHHNDTAQVHSINRLRRTIWVPDSRSVRF